MQAISARAPTRPAAASSSAASGSTAGTRPTATCLRPAPRRAATAARQQSPLQRLPLLARQRPQTAPMGNALKASMRPAGGSAGAGAVLSLEEQDKLCEDMAAFLRQDLLHLFDDQGIDASKYDDAVNFEDPITKYDSVQGYLFNIAMLRRVFSPTFILHDVRRTGALQLTFRWTMSMCLSAAKSSPLQKVFDPKLTFTGTSIMGINPETGRFNSHKDTWDAVQQQGFFSLEAFAHMLSQVMDLRRGPETVTPAGSGASSSSSSSAVAASGGQYDVLLKRRRYEVRRYITLPPTAATLPGGSAGASGAAGTAGGVYAAVEFGGASSVEAAQQAEQALRCALMEESEQPAGGGWLVPGPQSVPELLRKNEVLIPLASFTLW